VSPLPATSSYVKVVPNELSSGSKVVSWPTSAPAPVFSSIVVVESAISVGGSLKFETEIVNVFSSDKPPESVERTRMFAVFVVS